MSNRITRKKIVEEIIGNGLKIMAQDLILEYKKQWGKRERQRNIKHF